ncbi:hypothetical protein ABIE67_009109 [Streptomyces sp. V4I8]
MDDEAAGKVEEQVVDVGPPYPAELKGCVQTY